jgi:GNAT superfamily N-acetyltransferase
MAFKAGLRHSIRLSRFDAKAQKVAQRYKAADDGYLFAFATRLDKQGQNYGKPLMNALLRYLDATGQGCYLETLKPGNVGLYEHFSFSLKEQVTVKTGNLTMFAMYRPKNR